MNWKALGPLLGVIMLAALAFVYWPEVPVVPPPPEPASVTPPVAEDPAPPAKLRLVRPVNPQVATPTELPSLGPNAAIPPQQPQQPQQALYKLDPVPDPERLRELGIPESAVEPEDAGRLHQIDRKGIRAALNEKYEELQKCYPPQLAKTAKLELQLVEIPGRERAKVQSIALVSDGGVGRVAFERCARDALGDLRFDPPKGGEMRATVPLNDLGDNL